MDSNVTFRLPKSDRDKLKELAKDDGLSIGLYMKSLAYSQINETEPEITAPEDAETYSQKLRRVATELCDSAGEDWETLYPYKKEYYFEKARKELEL